MATSKTALSTTAARTTSGQGSIVRNIPPAQPFKRSGQASSSSPSALNLLAARRGFAARPASGCRADDGLDILAPTIVAQLHRGHRRGTGGHGCVIETDGKGGSSGQYRDHRYTAGERVAQQHLKSISRPLALLRLGSWR